MMPIKPICIIPVYNEADILPWTLRHIIAEGCEPYVLDNMSSDGSPQITRGFMTAMEVDGWQGTIDTGGKYDWTAILKCVEEIALERGEGRWCMLYDADEIRRPPDPLLAFDKGLHSATFYSHTFSLSQGLELVASCRYNAVDFQVRCYVAIDNGWTGQCSPEQYFLHYLPEHVDQTMPHIKCWLQGSERVDLHTHGGHQALFAGRKVYPEKFLIKHYPIRSQQHGERKIFQERIPRYTDAERAKNWHVQYDRWERTNASFLHDPKDLMCDQ